MFRKSGLNMPCMAAGFPQQSPFACVKVFPGRSLPSLSQPTVRFFIISGCIYIENLFCSVQEV